MKIIPMDEEGLGVYSRDEGNGYGDGHGTLGGGGDGAGWYHAYKFWYGSGDPSEYGCRDGSGQFKDSNSTGTGLFGDEYGGGGIDCP